MRRSRAISGLLLALLLVAAGAESAYIFTSVPTGLTAMILGPIILGALAALIMLLGRGTAPSHEPSAPVPHPGPNMSRISPAGLPGLCFTAGFIWMFWFGVPGFRPVVIGVAVVGCLAGLVLIAIGRRHRVPTDTPLGLSGTGHSPQGQEPDPSLRSG